MLAPFENLGERVDDRRDQFAYARGALYISRLVQIFVIDQTQEFGMLTIVIPNEVRELRDGFDRRDAIQIERFLGFRERAECMFQDSREELLLAAEIVVEHSLVRFGAACNLVDPRPEQAASRELLRGGEQDAASRALWISFDFWLIVHGGFVIDKTHSPDYVITSVPIGSMPWIRRAKVIGIYRSTVNRKRFNYVHITVPFAIGIGGEVSEIRP
jgi:hypothetical protein